MIPTRKTPAFANVNLSSANDRFDFSSSPSSIPAQLASTLSYAVKVIPPLAALVAIEKLIEAALGSMLSIPIPIPPALLGMFGLLGVLLATEAVSKVRSGRRGEGIKVDWSGLKWIEVV